MKTNKNIIRLIFGLKLTQYRNKVGFSLDQLSKESSISKSYLNEIEKGKKYPQADKILKLSQVLKVSYDDMVALKLEGELESLTDLLLSDNMQRVPLKALGLNEETLSNMLITNPQNTQIMLSTLLNVSISHNLNKQDFLQSALQSHLEAYHYYFPRLENSAEKHRELFFKTHDFINISNLEKYLFDHHKVKVHILNELESKEIGNVQSMYIQSKKTLLLNYYTSDRQRLFLIIKELSNQIESFKIRTYIYPTYNHNNFDEIKQDLESTHFSYAFLIPRTELINEVTNFFYQTTYNINFFYDIANKYQVTPFVLLRRITSLMKHQYNINRFFLMSLKNKKGTNDYRLNFDIKFMETQLPEINESIHHYCRKSATQGIITDFYENKISGNNFSKCQISELYLEEGTSKHLTIAFIDDNPVDKEYIKSLSLSILLTPKTRELIRFSEDPTINTIKTSVICEMCPIEDCDKRKAAAFILKKNKRDDILTYNINSLLESYS